MSQTRCKRCGFTDPMRWLRAGGGRSRPNGIHHCADCALMRFERAPKCPLHSPDIASVNTRWRQAGIPLMIEIGAKIKSP